jgi:hypothetical protein
MFNQDHGIGITADNAYAGLASQYHVSTTDPLLLLVYTSVLQQQYMLHSLHCAPASMRLVVYSVLRLTVHAVLSAVNVANKGVLHSFNTLKTTGLGLRQPYRDRVPTT